MIQLLLQTVALDIIILLCHFAFFTVPDAMGMVTEENRWIFDNKLGRAVVDEGEAPGKNAQKAKAYLQKLYDDISGK